MKLLSLFFAGLLVTYGCAKLWLVPSNAVPDSDWCRHWFCETDLETQHEYQEYLQARVQQAAKTVPGFAEILRRDPASSYRWCDLAEAMVESGQLETARYCMGTAIALAPHSAAILLRAANFFFRINDIPRAMHFSQAILSQIPDFDAIIFSNFDRFGIPVDSILQDGLPATPRAARSYFSHLLSSDRVADTELVWSWMTAHGYADDPIAGAYEAFLLRNKAYDEAAKSWVVYLGNRRGDLYRTNRVFNGDFENPPIGSPLDWQIGQVEGALITRDSGSVHSGRYSLHIRFAGTHNVALNQVSQAAIVLPGAYRLEYFIRTDALTTNEGVRLRVFDPANAALLDVLTDPVLGTNDWRLEVSNFVVKPQTHMVQVQVVRNVSQKFDNKIGGSAWVDGVKIEPVSP